MRQRLGALLCLALGGALIWSGLDASTAGVVGGPPPGTLCGTESRDAGVGAQAPTLFCPTGTIAITEHTTITQAGMAPDDPTPPANWTVHIKSDCYDTTSTSTPVDETVEVPNNGTATSNTLYVYNDFGSAAKCDYALSEQHRSGFTATFTPSSPVQLPDDHTSDRTGNDLKVALANDATARTTSPAPPTSPTPPSSSAPSNSASVSASSSSTVVPSVVPSSSGGGLANTGPSRSINGTLIGGIALCVLGFVLLFAGRVRKPRKHGA